MSDMTREEKIAAIYRKIMGKTIELECFDCLAKKGLKYPGSKMGDDGVCSSCNTSGKDIGLIRVKQIYPGDCMIGDVLSRFMANKSELASDMIKTLSSRISPKMRYNMRSPIEKQFNECIDYVYSLIESE